MLSLIHGLRFIDSFFPSGGYAYSFGLEAAVQGGAVQNAEHLSRYVVDQLRQGLGRREAVAVGLAHSAASRGDLAAMLAVDHELEAMKLGTESRQASRQMGRQVARIAGEQFLSHTVLQAYCAAIEDGTSPGHSAIALGLVFQATGWEKEAAMNGFLYQSCVGFVSAALKLLPIGQREGQRLLAEWIPVIGQISHEAASATTLSSWAPVQDIYAMRHARLESRLFRS